MQLRAALTLFLYLLHQLALCLWLGGVVGIGAVAAPSVFRVARQRGDTQSGMPLYDFAGEVNTLIFSRLSLAIVVLGVVLIASGLGYGVRSGLCPIRLRVRAGLETLAWGVAIAIYTTVIPRMSQADPASFQELHRLSAHMFQAELLLLLGSAALSGWLHLSGRSIGRVGEHVSLPRRLPSSGAPTPVTPSPEQG